MARYSVDPVCKSKLERKKAAHSSEHKGEKVYFCSAECKEEFEKKPLEYMAENLRTGS
ncbi:MAG: YHS domain-containing protein [Syntrophales bacterium]